jgi:hypothetical protein
MDESLLIPLLDLIPDLVEVRRLNEPFVYSPRMDIDDTQNNVILKQYRVMYENEFLGEHAKEKLVKLNKKLPTCDILLVDYFIPTKIQVQINDSNNNKIVQLSNESYMNQIKLIKYHEMKFKEIELEKKRLEAEILKYDQQNIEFKKSLLKSTPIEEKTSLSNRNESTINNQNQIQKILDPRIQKKNQKETLTKPTLTNSNINSNSISCATSTTTTSTNTNQTNNVNNKINKINTFNPLNTIEMSSI